MNFIKTYLELSFGFEIEDWKLNFHGTTKLHFPLCVYCTYVCGRQFLQFNNNNKKYSCYTNATNE